MRFASYRYTQGKGWLVLCIVKTWRPLYDRLNRLLSKGEGLAHWYIVTEEDVDGFHRRRSRIEDLAEDQGAL